MIPFEKKNNVFMLSQITYENPLLVYQSNYIIHTDGDYINYNSLIINNIKRKDLINIGNWEMLHLYYMSLLSLHSKNIKNIKYAPLIEYCYKSASFESFNTCIINDSMSVVKAINKNYCILLFLGSMCTKKLILLSVKQNGLVMCRLSNENKNDYDIVLAAVSNNGFVLQIASDKMKNNREIVMAAVNNNGNVLKYVPIHLQNNYEITLAAVLNDGNALEYASKYLQNDHKIVLSAIKNNENALYFCSDAIFNNRHFILSIINNNYIQFSCSRLKKYSNDYEIMLAFVTNYGFDVINASKELQNDYNIGLAAVSNNRTGEYVTMRNTHWCQKCAFSYLSDKLKSNAKIILTAIKNNKFAISECSDDIQNRHEIKLINTLVHYDIDSDEFKNILFSNDYIKYIYTVNKYVDGFYCFLFGMTNKNTKINILQKLGKYFRINILNNVIEYLNIDVFLKHKNKLINILSRHS
jgi:hypothetical protein